MGINFEWAHLFALLLKVLHLGKMFPVTKRLTEYYRLNVGGVYRDIINMWMECINDGNGACGNYLVTNQSCGLILVRYSERGCFCHWFPFSLERTREICDDVHTTHTNAVMFRRSLIHVRFPRNSLSKSYRLFQNTVNSSSFDIQIL